MKKIGKLFPLFALPIIACSSAITSCNQNQGNKIHLKNFTDPSLVVGVDQSDYWLCAEPAAYVKEKVLGLHRVGSLQQLYGANGFNQAVLVCKKDLLTSNPKYLNQIKNYLSGNLDYVSNPNNRLEIIKNIQNNQLDPSRSSVLNETNTSTQSLINCNAKLLESTSQDINLYKTFISKAHSIDKDVQTSNDDFYRGFPSYSETTKEGKINILAPDGAPAVGIANVLKNINTLSNETSIKFVNPVSILQVITLYKPDLAILPSNHATKLYNEYNNEYVFLSTVTWGNLYFLSKKFDTSLTLENMKELLYGKTLGVQQLVGTPGLALKIILKDNNINYGE